MVSLPAKGVLPLHPTHSLQTNVYSPEAAHYLHMNTMDWTNASTTFKFSTAPCPRLI